MTPNQLRLRAPSHKDLSTTNSSGFTPNLAIYPSDLSQVSRQNVAIFLLFLFLFFFFSSGRNIGLLFMGVLNLLQVVNETRVGFIMFRRQVVFQPIVEN